MQEEWDSILKKGVLHTMDHSGVDPSHKVIQGGWGAGNN